METSRHFETFRHGEKQGEDLSEIGKEHSREKAAELLSQIEASPPGTVIYIMPSNVGRAIETRNVIEQELKGLIEGRDDIEIISVKDREKIAAASGDLSKKYIVSEIQASSLLGFKDTTPSIPGFLSYKKLYRGNEDLIGMTWATRPEEMDELRQKISNELPDIKDDEIRPKEFIETPEEAASKYLQLMKRMAEITDKHFPGHSSKGVFIGHNLSADFAALALLGKDISLKSINEVGGQFRNYLESSYYELQEGQVKAKYRDAEAIQERSIDEVMEELKHESDDRKKEWTEQN